MRGSLSLKRGSNGTTWEGVGTGANDTAFGSTVYADGGIHKLAIGGSFTTVDGLAANRVVLREGCASCTGDVDGNGEVGFSDIVRVLGAWGACEGCPEDIDGNGFVNFDAHCWSRCPKPVHR